jgi:uncharacterized DUF497 family protein
MFTEIIWDELKNQRLIVERGVSFEEVAEILLNKEHVDIIENPAHPNQNYFIVKLNNYIHVVPFVLDEDKRIILKTIFPSRKFNKIYGGQK